MSISEFITAVFEKAFVGLWPCPKSDLFCRCCNYTEFENKEELVKHYLSVEHKVRGFVYDDLNI